MGILSDYRQTNPGSMILLDVRRPDESRQPIFRRLYCCFAVCKQGFIKGCRNIIGLDGCHLKGSFGGQLLAVVGNDGNENIFSVAWPVVEAEMKDSWSWFLTCLLQDIGPLEEHGWTFMSDRQKVCLSC